MSIMSFKNTFENKVPLSSKTKTFFTNECSQESFELGLPKIDTI